MKYVVWILFVLYGIRHIFKFLRLFKIHKNQTSLIILEFLFSIKKHKQNNAFFLVR